MLQGRSKALRQKGQGRIDVFWPGLLLVEHKSAGEDLDAAYLADGGPNTYASDAERVAVLFRRHAALTSLV